MSGRVDTEQANGLCQGLKQEVMEAMTREDRTEWGQEPQILDGRETLTVPLLVQHWALGIVLGERQGRLRVIVGHGAGGNLAILRSGICSAWADVQEGEGTLRVSELSYQGLRTRAGFGQLQSYSRWPLSQHPGGKPVSGGKHFGEAVCLLHPCWESLVQGTAKASSPWLKLWMERGSGFGRCPGHI